MSREVEILKIGTILPNLKGNPETDSTIMVVWNGGPIFDYYVKILKKNCSDDYKYLKTDKAIVGRPFPWLNKKDSSDTIKGFPDGEPTIGKQFSINGYWHTSTVNRIIENCILITNNSVYVIHDISKFREKQLNELGI